MNSNRGSIKKRLDRLERLQRELEFDDLTMALNNCQELTEAQWAVVEARLIRLFEEEQLAGVPLQVSLDKLPAAFKSAVLNDLAKDAVKEDAKGPS